MMWRAFQQCFDDDFKDAVDQLIANQRAAPMVDQVGKAIEECKVRRHQNGVRDGYASTMGLAGVLKDAERANRVADKDYVKACVQLVKDKVNGKLDHKQFLEGCGLLEEVARRISGR